MSRRIRGTALVLVLRLIALLTALVGAFALSARVEHLQQGVQDSDARGQERARAGLEYALSRLRQDPQRPAWQADGSSYRWQFDGTRIDIAVTDEEGKLNLNRADPLLLEGFLKALGETPESARQLAGTIIDWRDADDLAQPTGGAEAADYAAAGLPYGPSNQSFQTLGEVQRVLGMRAALYQKMLPYITLYSRGERPDPRVAAGPVLTALGLDAEQVLAQRALLKSDESGTSGTQAYAGGSGTYSIESRAIDGSGRASVLQAVVRNGPGGGSLGGLIRCFAGSREWQQDDSLAGQPAAGAGPHRPRCRAFPALVAAVAAGLGAGTLAVGAGLVAGAPAAAAPRWPAAAVARGWPAARAGGHAAVAAVAG